MSRIGNRELVIPAGVTVTNENENSKTKTKTITKRKTKNKSSYRTLPLFKEIEELLLYTKKMQKYYMSIFKEILKNNDLRKIRSHDLRHSCATLLLKKRNIFKRNTRLVRTFKF